MERYISHGAFILAAVQAGYTYKLDGGPNCCFAMSIVRWAEHERLRGDDLTRGKCYARSRV